MYRLPGSRRPLLVLEGPYEGASCVVADIAADAIAQVALVHATAYWSADGWPAQAAALEKLYGLFVYEAQPAWDIWDHHGPVPATKAGMWRLPLALALEFVGQWLEPTPSAVDEVIPPGPFRDALNKELREKRQE